MRPLPSSAHHKALSVATAFVRAVTITLTRGFDTITVEPDSGRFTQDARRAMRWDGQIVVSEQTLIPTSRFDILTPFGTRAQVELGIELAGGSISQVPYGRYIVSKSNVAVAPAAKSVTVDLIDIADAIAGYRFETPFEIPASTDVADAVNAVVFDRTFDDPGLEATGATLARKVIFGLDPEKDPWRELGDLVAGFGLRLWYDRGGQLILDSEPFPDPANATTLAGPVSITGAFENRPPNVVVARGEPSDPATPPVQAVAVDSDPSSPTWAGPAPGNSPYGRRTRFYSSPIITTQSAAAAAASSILARSAGAGEEWILGRAYDPTWDPDDIVSVAITEDVGLIVAVDAVTVDLEQGTNITSRGISTFVINPADEESPGESP